ncbi:MAG: hypothetical protein H7Z37_14385, partial [Pyrinomonadaceae bacterium]|nr:hypothetical protein [Pyrinomonadaceae bacterium]
MDASGTKKARGKKAEAVESEVSETTQPAKKNRNKKNIALTENTLNGTESNANGAQAQTVTEADGAIPAKRLRAKKNDSAETAKVKSVPMKRAEKPTNFLDRQTMLAMYRTMYLSRRVDDKE